VEKLRSCEELILQLQKERDAQNRLYEESQLKPCTIDKALQSDLDEHIVESNVRPSYKYSLSEDITPQPRKVTLEKQMPLDSNNMARMSNTIRNTAHIKENMSNAIPLPPPRNSTYASATNNTTDMLDTMVRKLRVMADQLAHDDDT
jgi:hypothetical protein